MEKNTLRVAYLMGTAFCGSTLMAFLMDSHPQIASVGETSIGIPWQQNGAQYPCSCGELLPDCPLWREIFGSVNQQGFEFSATQWANDYRYKNPLLYKALSSYAPYKAICVLQEIAASILPIHRGRIQRIHRANVAFVGAVLSLTKSELFFDTSKGPRRLYHLLSIPEFDIRVIRMVRDVRAYAASRKKHRGYAVEKSAKNWKSFHLRASNLIRAIPAQKVFTLRYEDLCQNPGYWLHDLCHFLDVDVLEPPDTIISREHHIIGNRMRRKEVFTLQLDESWKERLTAAEISRTLCIAGETNERLGYTE